MLFQLSALRAIWLTWCKIFYENLDPDEWSLKLIVEFKSEFVKRIAEAPAMAKWMTIIKNKRTSSESSDKEEKIPEKEFLLIMANMVNPTKDSLPMENGEILMELQGWFGNYFLIDHDALQGNKPKFKIIIDPWLALMAKYDPYVQSCVPTWHAALPQAVSLSVHVDVVLGD